MNEKPHQVVSISKAVLDFSQLKPKFQLINLELDNELELTEDE